jgi:hypothetical protein
MYATFLPSKVSAAEVRSIERIGVVGTEHGFAVGHAEFRVRE